MLSSFGAQAVYQGRIEQKIDALQEDMSAVKKDMSSMATKEDVAAFGETRARRISTTGYHY